MRLNYKKVSDTEVIVNDEIVINGLENIDHSLTTHYIVYKITNKINGRYYIG
jgi:hypothetical protein